MNTTVDRTAARDMTPIVLGLMPFGLLIGLTIGTHRAGRRAGSATARRIARPRPSALAAKASR